MPGAPLPANEAERLDSLRSFGVLDSLPEQGYDDIVQIASSISDSPIALISLIDENRQWFKARVGLDVPETARDLAFCGHAILHPDDVFIVEDALEDERFASNPLVLSDPSIRFYAGAPLTTSSGLAFGTLCVIDTVPRELNENQIRTLQALARQVMAQLELRRAIDELKDSAREREAARQQLVISTQQLKAANEALARESTTDVLTGLANRRAFELKLDEEFDRAARYGTELSLMLLDADHFKSVNDEFGHSAGDQTLKRLAEILTSNTRLSDTLARYGGEEFAILLPNAGREIALGLAERFRAAIENADWEIRPMTVSVGVATRSDFVQTRRALVDAADRAMYDAKSEGRNRVAQASG
jgi:diguanylate cyclase (GGDEF)-like protein